MSTHAEVERKYDAGPDTALPDLAALAPGGVGSPVDVRLSATYFDTADLRLARHRITLRRRTGGDDAGWHLKLPVGPDERTEVRRPLGRTTRAVPKALVDEVRAFVRDAPLAPVAVLRTHRVEHHLADGSGATLAVLADDTVTADRLAGPDRPASSAAWRELEVELVDGDRSVLDAADTLLRSAGFAPSASASKLARVLDAPAPAAEASLRRGSSTGDVVLAYLAAQVEELLVRHRAARADVPDGVHKMRVAARRLRSAMATYRPVVDRAQTDPLRAELKWLGQLLGAPRDAEVQHDRLLAMLDEQPPELVLGPVRRRIDLELRLRHKTGHASLVAALDGPRCARLLDDLEALLAQPALTKQARAKARSQLPRLVRRAVRRVDAALAVADAATGTEREHALHEVRKAAKRARYAAESAAPVVGAPAQRLATRMEDVQEILGELQDSVTSRALLRELAVAAHGAQENGFTFGLLYGVERHRADQARAQAGAALKKASARSARRWLT